MKITSPTLHGCLDYVTVVLFLVAPTLVGLSGIAGTLSYTLAAIHLGMTLATDFSLGEVKVIPFAIHGWVERVVGLALILLPFALGFDAPAQVFYVVMGRRHSPGRLGDGLPTKSIIGICDDHALASERVVSRNTWGSAVTKTPVNRIVNFSGINQPPEASYEDASASWL